MSHSPSLSLPQRARQGSWVLALFILQVLSPTSLVQAACTDPKTEVPGRTAPSVFGFHYVRDEGMGCYVNGLLVQIMPVVVTLAIIMIIFSGVEYMLSGYTPDNAKKAKQRIVSIVSGLIFFVLLRGIVNQFKLNLSL